VSASADVNAQRRAEQAPPVVALLEVDPELGAGLAAADFAVARRYARTAALSVAPGPWACERLPVCELGLLVLRGSMLREVTVGDRIRAELIGPGDLLRPWDTESFDALPLPWGCSWTVLEPSELAVLDGRLGPVIGRWPALMGKLIHRVVRRSQRMALLTAIGELQGVDVRLEALLWFLAERWGRVTLAGVVVPFALTHETLGRLIGARRPSVTSALTALAATGSVRRLPDRTWLLANPA
jgi:hypothetical protein